MDLKRALQFAGIAGLAALLGCTEVNRSYYPDYGYDRPYSGGSYGRPYYGPDHQRYRYRYRDRDYEWYRYDRERHELEKERERAERERRKLEEARRQSYAPPPASRGRPRQTHCPAGFSPSERKCSKEERKRGCKDMRLDSGLGCVKR